MILKDDHNIIRDSSMVVCGECGSKGKKKPHKLGDDGSGLFCGSCGRQLLSYHYTLIEPGVRDLFTRSSFTEILGNDIQYTCQLDQCVQPLDDIGNHHCKYHSCPHLSGYLIIS